MWGVGNGYPYLVVFPADAGPTPTVMKPSARPEFRPGWGNRKTKLELSRNDTMSLQSLTMAYYT